MPVTPLHTLLWSQDQSRYELYIEQRLVQTFEPENFGAWLAWLENATAFAFQGGCGSLNVYLEARRRGRYYWYAYHTNGKHTRKRYLGRTTQVTFARLEEAAHSLHQNSSSPSLGSQPPNAQTPTSDGVVSAPPPETTQGMVLLATKLAPPLLSPLLVGRDRLLTRLDAAGSHQLTLLSTSAGWGKTTLLSVWASRCIFSLAWLSLDELDNEPTRFWVSVLSALRTCLPGVGQTALLMLRSPQPPPLSACLSTLLNDLGGQNTPTFLLLDDYHLIGQQTIHDSLLFLLDHLPAHLHLVLSSRVDPPLALARLRVRGQLLELRDADLRFEEEETARFLTHTMNLSLSEAEIAELARHTEGWIAGLQLAALSLEHHPDRAAFVRSFTGGHRYVLDYVQEEILARLTPSMRDFVLSTSILHRLSAPLCQAVTAQVASQQALETIERANLFLVPLDDERRWYRFHDLFREALLARLHATQPELVPLLHQRAASWYERQGQFREAMAHWLAARDFSSAARLMEETARRFWLRGEAATMARWVMQLPKAVVREHARLVLTSALYLLNANYYDGGTQFIKASKEAEQLIMRVETALQQLEEDAGHTTSTEVRQLQQRLRLLRAWSATFEPLKRGDGEQFRLIYQQMQDLEKEEDVVWQMIPLYTTFTLHYVFLQEGALLVPQLLEARQQANQSADHFTMLEVRRRLALTCMRAGRLHLAHQECLASLALLEQVEGHTMLTASFSLGLALVLYQWNRLQEAYNALQRVIHDAAAWQHATLQSWSYRTLVKIELAAGNLATAHQALQEAEQVEQRMGSVLQQSWTTSVRVQWWLAVGNLAEASDWATHVVFDQDAWEPYRSDELLALVQVSLAQAEYVQAIEILERFRSHLDRPGNILMTISFLSLYLVALQQAGKRELARAVAVRLFALTEPEGYLRLYLDGGNPMRQTLQSLLTTSQDTAEKTSVLSYTYILRLLAAFEQEEQMFAVKRDAQPARPQSALSQLPKRLSGSISSVPAPFAPLTPQERRVLHLLAQGASNQQIATRLVISLVTVKKHVTNLLAKLGAVNRTQAVMHAREYGLL